MDINDTSNLTLSEIIPDGGMDNNRLNLALRSLECKLLKIPQRISKANPNVDFTRGDYESVMIDIDDITTEMYELVMCIRECLPLKDSNNE